MSETQSIPELSLVVALYFEEECVGEFVKRVRQELDPSGLDYELVFVDDGSTDRTVPIVDELAAADPRIKLVQLSRNHGKEAAVTAGIEHASGRYIVMMDPDLQDPPDRILDFKRKIEEGYDLVFGVRTQKADSLLNVLFSKIFWTTLNGLTGLAIPKNLAVMRIINRQFADAFLSYPEKVRFIEGLFMHVGMRRTTLEIANYERYAGSSKYNFTRKMNLALNAILAFSDRPIQMSVTMGLLMLATSGVLGGWLFFRKLLYGIGLTGWTSLILAIVFIGGIQTVILGIVGMYVGKIYNEVKGRPVYRTQKTVNLDEKKAIALDERRRLG